MQRQLHAPTLRPRSACSPAPSRARISLFEAVDLAVAVRDGWRQWLAAATPEDWTFWLPSVAAPLHCAASQPLQRHATAFSADIAETVQRLDVGKLTAFTDGRVRGCFEDRALVQVDASGAVSAVLCDGTQVLCTVDSAVRDERLAWCVRVVAVVLSSLHDASLVAGMCRSCCGSNGGQPWRKRSGSSTWTSASRWRSKCRQRWHALSNVWQSWRL